MKIFPKFYARRLHFASNLEEITGYIYSWMDEVIYFGSPFLRQVASHFLIHLNGTRAPKKVKQFVGDHLLEINGEEDFKAYTVLAFMEAYRRYNASYGLDIVNWLSWQIPYELSKVLPTKVVKPISPWKEDYIPSYFSIIDNLDRKKYFFDTIVKDLNLSRQHKYYYRSKIK